MKKIILFLIVLSAVSFGQISKSVLTPAQKDTIKKIVTDSLSANSRGWQTSTQVSQRIADSLNTNSRGWRNQAQAKQDALDTLNNTPILSSEPLSSDTVFAKTSQGLRKISISSLPVSNPQINQIEQSLSLINSQLSTLQTSIDNISNDITVMNADINLIERKLDSLSQVVQSLGGTAITILPPYNLSFAEVTSSSITISATLNSSTDSVLIEYQPFTEIWYSVVVDSGQPLTVSGLSASTNYQFRLSTIKYISGVKYQSLPSELIDTTTLAIPLIPHIYANTGNNVTGWIQVQESGNTIEINPTAGNPDSCISFEYSGTNDQNYMYYDFTEEDTLWISFDYYLKSNFDVGVSQTSAVFSFYSGTTAGVILNLRGNGVSQANQWRVTGGGTVTTSNSNGFATDQWIKIQIGFIYGSGTVKVYADNQTIYSASGLTLSPTSYNRMRFGSNSAGANPADSVYWRIDNIVLSKDSGAAGNVPSGGGGGGGYETVIYAGVTSSGTGDGSSRANQMSLSQAISSVVPGDTVLLDIGAYNLATGGTFSRSGTSSLPIVWIGTLASGDKEIVSATGDSSTFFYNNTSTTGAGFISVTASYNEFHNIIFQQNNSGKGTMNISGTRNKIIGCAFKYPSNVGSSSNHSLRIYSSASNTLLKNNHFYYGSRCIVWSEADSTLVENNVFYGATNHYAIQVMPYTTDDGSHIITRTIIRYNLFLNNPYKDIYLRHNRRGFIYSNILINSGSVCDIAVQPVYLDTVNSEGTVFAYNTMIDATNFNVIYNEAMQQTIFKNNIIMNTTSTPDILWRFSTTYNPILRHQIDYNLYYYPNELFSTNGVRGIWGSAYPSVWWNDWKTITGYEVNSLVDVAPTFVDLNSNNYGYGLEPLNTSSPQIMGDTSVISLLPEAKDFNGNTIDGTYHTIGAVQYVP